MQPTSLLQRSLAGLAALCAAALLAGPAWATHDDDGEEIVDPPARVGRISALRGSVDASAEPGAAWEQAKINQPVTTGTALFAAPGSQAEVRIGSGSVRLDGNTQAVFSQLDDHGIAIDVAQGTVRARVRNLPTGDRFSLSADGVRAEAQGPGDYRVDFDPDRRAYVVRAIAGRLRIVTSSTSLNLEPGQEGLIEDGGESLHVRRMGADDAFDAWAEARDREQDRIAASRYVSPETTGIEALDDHGHWSVVADYGPVWYPRVVMAGWAPYRYGHWAWVHPWGWTWIDDAPWGFAPFHYGRWALIGGTWGWVPGPYVHRPVYAPALVGYVGGRPRSSLSVSIGIGAPIGWFPLGPREVYVPPYRCSPRYGQSVNWVADNRPVTRQPVPAAPVYRYAQRPEALTVVSESNFRSASSIARERLQLTQQQVAQLQPVAAAVPGARLQPEASVRSQLGLPAATLPAPPARLAPRGETARALPTPRGFIEQQRGGEPRRAEPRAEPPRAGEPPRSIERRVVQPRIAEPVAPAPAAPATVMPNPAVRVERGAEPRVEVPGRFVNRARIDPDGPRDDPRADHGNGREQRFVPPRPLPDRPAAMPQQAMPQQVMPQVIPPPVPAPRVMPEPQVIPPPRSIAMPPQPMPPAVQPPAAPPRQIHMPAPPVQQPAPGWTRGERGGDRGDRGGGPRADGQGQGRGGDGGGGGRGDGGPRGMRFER